MDNRKGMASYSNTRLKRIAGRGLRKSNIMNISILICASMLPVDL